MFFRRRVMPDTRQYHIYCEIGPGDVDLTTRWESIPSSFYYAQDGGLLIAFDTAAAIFRFNLNAGDVPSQIGSGIIVVPAALSERYFANVTMKKLDARIAVDQMEKEISMIDLSPNEPTVHLK